MTELLDLFSSAISGLTAELVSNLGGAGSNLGQQLNALAAKAQLSGTVYPQADGESTGYALLWLPEGDALQLVAQLGPAGPATIQLYASPVRVTLYGSTSVPGVSIGPLWIRVATEAAAPDETVADTRRFSLEGSFWVSLDQKKGLNFDNFSLTIPPFTLGTTGVVLSIDKAIPHFLAGSIPLEFDPLKLPPSFSGLLLAGSTAVLPPSLTFAGFDTLSAPIAAIGTGGFTGTFDVVNTAPELKDPKTPPPSNPATGTYDCKGAGKILGFAAAMRKITLSFQSSALTASEITAVLRLPGFNADVEANAFLSLDGKLTVAVTNLQSLGTLKIDGIVEFTAESIVLSNSGDGPAFVSLAGKLTPLLQTDIFNWPTLDIRALRIDTAGNLSFDGGWLDLPKSICLDLFGFQLEVTKIAFGSDGPSRKWFGLSGGVKLIDGMPAGASADGLRISWSVDASGEPVPGSFGFSFDGIGVAFEIPDVLKFSGSVSMKTDPAKPGDTRFEGAVSLDLLALGMTVDATVVFGRQKNQPYMGIYLAADIPSAIPLFSTGLGIYGIDALACLNMKPNKQPGQAWYDIEKTGWFHQAPVGVTGIDKDQKWTPAAGNFAFGAGVTIGTVDDNGRKFNGKFLLLILLPGPELGAARLKALQAEKFASLATLAGGAAHELATPLSTIAVVSKELERSLAERADDTENLDDVRLIRGEVERCRQILQALTAEAGQGPGEVPERIEPEDFNFGLPGSYYYHGNEPDMLASGLFLAAQRADLADQWTRWVYDQSYTTAPDGLVGNDDAGTLSAWAVLAGIGLYPRPGAPGWDLVAPRFDRVTLQLGGKSVVIEAPGVHAGQPRQATAMWQGQPLTSPPPQGGQLGRWLPHALVTQGGVLRFLAK